MKKYAVILADPPWEYRVWSGKGVGRSAESHYPTMPVEQICALPVAELADRDSALLLWVTYPNLYEAFKVIEAWSFVYKTVAFTWVKTCRKSEGFHVGMGHYTRANAEICLLATKGSPARLSRSVRQLIVSPIEQHSKKPDEVRDRIVQLFGEVPRIELFARQKADGWDCFGNEIESDIILKESIFMSYYIDELRERIEQNYEDFKAETLEFLDKENIFNLARHIAAVEDVYHFAMTQGSWVEEGEAAYLLEFCEPLKLLADTWEEYLDDCDQDFRMVVEEVLDRNDNTDSYVTVALADELQKKHGTDYRDALLAEAISAGERYLRLLNLLEDEGVDLCIELE